MSAAASAQSQPVADRAALEARRDEVARQFIDLIDRFAPGFEDTLIEYEVLSPAQKEQVEKEQQVDFLYVLPSVISGAAVVVLWRWLFNP